MVTADELIKKDDKEALSVEKIDIEKQKIAKVLEAQRSDEMRIEILEKNLLKKKLPKDLQKFVFANIAKLHERKRWWVNAARFYRNAADIAVTFREREGFFMKEVEMYIKAMMYNYADEATKKAAEAVANPKNRDLVKQKVIQLYLNEARIYEMTEKRTHAIKAYEKVLSLLSEEHKDHKDLRDCIISKLIILYEHIGNVRESIRLRDLLKR